jgi:CBS domain-containing protein
MQVRDIMTPDPVYCTRQTSLTDVARMMVTHDCGIVPVVENTDTKKLVGVVTDRDMVCRTLAQGRDPITLAAGDIMSSPVVTVFPETSVEECAETMGQNQVRRVPVLDHDGVCCGMVSQADLALHAPVEETAEVVKDVSQPTTAASSLNTPAAALH